MKMKQNILLICLSLFALISCTAKDEASYSCNPEINSWVKSNIIQIQSMKRTEWLKLDESKKKPTYRAFTAEEKYNFWLLKINEVMQLESLSIDEKNHLEKLFSKIKDNPEWFNDDFNKDDDEMTKIELFAYEWKEEAKNKFGWSDTFIKSILSSGNKVVDKMGSLEVATVKKNVRFKSTAEANQSNCNCGVGYFWSTCDSSISTSGCSSGNCKTTRSGCSFLWLSACDGYCV
jgi:hypothetical protein